MEDGQDPVGERNLNFFAEWATEKTSFARFWRPFGQSHNIRLRCD